ncbi:mechanosensitive ion channel family protein [Nitrososphaera sp.]|uniref:mechanosensitive ion channel family protein n=1 Tax=Nitrososphaera sp. TaxID=1971748 RepID=UPI00317F2AF9
MAELTNSTSIFGFLGQVNLFGAEVALDSIILTVIVIVAGFAIAHGVRLFTTRVIGSKLPHDARKNLGRTFYYGIIAIALLSALGVSGLDLSGVFLAGGIAGIVIGFATQSLVSNLISGIFLHFDKPMKVGDPVLITGKLPDVAGVVVEVTALSARFRMFDGTYVRMPNSDVFLSEIRNFSGAVARRVEFSIGVAYKEDTVEVIDVIKNSLMRTPLVLVEPVPDLYVNNLGDSSVQINVWCWVPFSVWFDMKKQLVEQVKRELDAKGIEIPFPQRVLHLPGPAKKKKPKGGPVSPESLDRGTSTGLHIEEFTDSD